MRSVFSPADLECTDSAAGAFEVNTNGASQVTVDCTSDGVAFSCSYTGSQDEFTFEGSFTDWTEASGSFAYTESSCGTANGTFTASD
ncbi:MAG: hypothetical protein GY913_12215 [Proteobacteria bacterium]|nr:hypothetical protein [Pseudomonadota bacterium]MCP4917681.1 hypothetical protein [Pseudomonadota bacterium]